MDNMYRGFGIEKLQFMLRETNDALCMLISTTNTCKYSKKESEVLMNARKILEYRIDKIKSAITEMKFEKNKNFGG